MMRPSVLVGLGVAIVFAAVLALGRLSTHALTAPERSDAGVSRHDSQVARLDARLFFDNPFEQIAIVDYAVVDHRVTPDGPRCQSAVPYDYETERGLQQVVAAYTLFGFEVGRVLIDCDGSALRLRPGETLLQAAGR